MTQDDRKRTEVKHCPACRSKERRVELEREGFDLFRCGNCDLVYVSPVFRDLRSIYTDDISSSTSKYYANSEKSDTRTFTNRLELIEKYTNKGHLLDIGCNVGTMLYIANARGWEVTGFEPNPKAAEICRKKGISVINDFFDGSASDNYSSKFDAVYLGDVIEHVADPFGLITNILNVLKKGGTLMIITPDFESKIARYFQIKPEEHILYFNNRSLLHLLENFELNVKQIIKTTRNRDLNALQYSSTFTRRPRLKYALRILSALRISSFFNFMISLFVRDEILVIAIKK